MSKPIIQCITNNVTKTDCANAVLAAKGSPIMAHHIEEVEEVQSFSSALLLNLGATNDYEAMKKALFAAHSLNHPVVLDPVGIAGISFRRNFCKELLASDAVSVIRGNYKEIAALVYDTNTGVGLDAEGLEITSATNLLTAMKEYASKHKLILIASGETDLVTDGLNTKEISVGSPMMSSITGTGCMLSCILAVACAYNKSFDTVCSTLFTYGKCGENAALKTLAQNAGAGTFHQFFMDELSLALWSFTK